MTLMSQIRLQESSVKLNACVCLIAGEVASYRVPVRGRRPCCTAGEGCVYSAENQCHDSPAANSKATVKANTKNFIARSNTAAWKTHSTYLIIPDIIRVDYVLIFI